MTAEPDFKDLMRRVDSIRDRLDELRAYLSRKRHHRRLRAGTDHESLAGEAAIHTTIRLVDAAEHSLAACSNHILLLEVLRRRPDLSGLSRDAQFHCCMTGDCEHENAAGCVEELQKTIRAFAQEEDAP